MYRFSTVFGLLFCFSAGVANGQSIPAARKTDWSQSGHTLYTKNHARLLNVTNVGAVGNGSTPADSSIQKAIDSLFSLGGGIVFIPQGTYNMTAQLVLKTNVILRGEGSDETVLRFNLGGSNDCIYASGSEGSSTALTASHSIGTRKLKIGSHSFVAGDWVRLYHTDNSLIYSSWSNNYIGQIVQLDSVKSDTLYLHDALRVNMALSQTPSVRIITPVKEVGVEDLRIVRSDATSAQTSHINFVSVVNSWVYGVESDSANFAHFTFQKSSNIMVRGCYIRRAHNYGSGGKAYGVVFQYTTGNCRVEDNIFQRLRHAVLLQACPNGNVVAYNYSNDPYWTSYPPDYGGDIVLHGNYPYFNLFEGNIFNTYRSDNSHGINGPFNCALRNRFYLYGLVMTTGTADSQTYVGNEITGSGAPYFVSRGQYTVFGNGHYEQYNNRNGTIIPSGSSSTLENSLYLSAAPDFWVNSGTWPSLGGTNTLNSGTIPALYRFNNITLKTVPHGQGTALPVSLLNFEASLQGGEVMLQWSTAQEINNSHFEVRRGDGDEQEYLTTIEGSGQSNRVQYYQTADLNPKSSWAVYTLYQTDYDGTTRLVATSIVQFDLPSGFELKPIPVKGELLVETTRGKMHGTIEISDLSGRVLISEKGSFPMRINTQELPTGSYQVAIFGENGAQIDLKRLLK